MTFSADGGIRWSQPEEIDDSLNAPTLPAELVQKFFRTAARVLLRPLPPPEQDFTSSGRIGKLMVVKRLLPLFEQYDPDTATALRAQLATLSSGLPPNTIKEEHSLLTQDLQLAKPAGELLAGLQERLDRAKTSKDRDAIIYIAHSIWRRLSRAKHLELPRYSPLLARFCSSMTLIAQLPQTLSDHSTR